MRKIQRKVKTVLVYLLAFSVGYVSMLYFLSDQGVSIGRSGVSNDVVFRKNYLVRKLKPGSRPSDFFQSPDMQYAGEWVLGTYAMAVYAVTNIAMNDPATALESSGLIREWVESCFDEQVKAFDMVAWNENPLDERVIMKDRGHIGYYGHLNLMLGCYALLNNDGYFSELHKSISDAIARRMLKHAHRHIETYPFETYPPDNTVAVVSLKVADLTMGTTYQPLIEEWLAQTRKIEYEPYGLVAFQIDSVSGKPLQMCRGSNIAWNSFFIPLIDKDYALEQFRRFQKLMLIQGFGMAAAKEYPRGNLFRMDCDTGPVLFGLGGTATGFSVAGARWMKDAQLVTHLLRSCEFLGVSMTKNKERRYLTSPIVGEAIMLAMKTACQWRALWVSKE